MILMRFWLLFAHPFSECSVTGATFKGAFEKIDFWAESLLEAPGQVVLSGWMFWRKIQLGRIEAHFPRMVAVSLLMSMLNVYTAIKSIVQDLSQENKLRERRGAQRLSVFGYVRHLFSAGQCTSLTLTGHAADEALMNEVGYVVRPPSIVQVLDLSENGICDVSKLAGALQSNETLGVVRLSRNSIEHIEDIGEALKTNTTLFELRLSRNRISNIRPIADALQVNRSLCELRLFSNKIRDINGLAIALQVNPTLRYLVLSENLIDDVTTLGEAMTLNTSLEVLKLNDNRITDVDPLAAALVTNSTLRELDLSSNPIGSFALMEKTISDHKRKNGLNQFKLVVSYLDFGGDITMLDAFRQHAKAGRIVLLADEDVDSDSATSPQHRRRLHAFKPEVVGTVVPNGKQFLGIWPGPKLPSILSGGEEQCLPK